MASFVKDGALSFFRAELVVAESDMRSQMHVCIIAELLELPVLIRQSSHLLLPAEMLRKEQLQDPTRVVPWRLAFQYAECASSIKLGNMIQNKGNT